MVLWDWCDGDAVNDGNDRDIIIITFAMWESDFICSQKKSSGRWTGIPEITRDICN